MLTFEVILKIVIGALFVDVGAITLHLELFKVGATFNDFTKFHGLKRDNPFMNEQQQKKKDQQKGTTQETTTKQTQQKSI